VSIPSICFASYLLVVLAFDGEVNGRGSYCSLHMIYLSAEWIHCVFVTCSLRNQVDAEFSNDVYYINGNDPNR
jgi:hypothetical protein